MKCHKLSFTGANQEKGFIEVCHWITTLGCYDKHWQKVPKTQNDQKPKQNVWVCLIDLKFWGTYILLQLWTQIIIRYKQYVTECKYLYSVTYTLQQYLVTQKKMCTFSQAPLWRQTLPTTFTAVLFQLPNSSFKWPESVCYRTKLQYSVTYS